MRLLTAAAPHRRLRSLAVALVGTLAAALMGAIEFGRFESYLSDERIYQTREVQEGLAALHRDLEMINHLASRPAGAAIGEVSDFVSARRDQLTSVRWLGHLHGPEERPEVLLASVEMRGYDPRRDHAVAPLLSAIAENSLTGAVPGSHRNSATLALVLGPPAEGDKAALVALVDANDLLSDSLNALDQAMAPFDLRLGGHLIGRWPRVHHRGRLTTAESRPVSVGALDFALEFAAPAASEVAWRVLPQPLIVLVAALVVGAVAAMGGRPERVAEPASAPPRPPPPPDNLHRTRLWRLGELAATLAHDLGQPLNVIRLTAEAAQDTHERGRLDGERLTRSLRNAVDQALRAQAMIDGLVAITRRPGQQPSRLAPVGLVRQVLARNLERLNGQGVRLRWHADLSVPPVLGHAVRLDAAIQHMLNNACEALSARGADGGDAGMVWVACRPEGDDVAIEITDNGLGFPPELLPLIDDPRAPLPERAKGCGLGLTVILGVAAEMGGRLSIADAQPGTRATLLLPSARRSLLLVEDDSAAAEALAGHLTSHGWQVRVAHGGHPALTMFKEVPADAVITDLHMADGDGWQLIENLRVLSPDLPIIATSTADENDSRRAVTAGAALVLRKPLCLQDVREELEGLFTDTC